MSRRNSRTAAGAAPATLRDQVRADGGRNKVTAKLLNSSRPTVSLFGEVHHETRPWHLLMSMLPEFARMNYRHVAFEQPPATVEDARQGKGLRKWAPHQLLFMFAAVQHGMTPVGVDRLHSAQGDFFRSGRHLNPLTGQPSLHAEAEFYEIADRRDDAMADAIAAAYESEPGGVLAIVGAHHARNGRLTGALEAKGHKASSTLLAGGASFMIDQYQADLLNAASASGASQRTFFIPSPVGVPPNERIDAVLHLPQRAVTESLWQKAWSLDPGLFSSRAPMSRELSAHLNFIQRRGQVGDMAVGAGLAEMRGGISDATDFYHRAYELGDRAAVLDLAQSLVPAAIMSIEEGFGDELFVEADKMHDDAVSDGVRGAVASKAALAAVLTAVQTQKMPDIADRSRDSALRL